MIVSLRGNHISNSEDFVDKIADPQVPLGQKLVSYSVFTSISINEVATSKMEAKGPNFI